MYNKRKFNKINDKKVLHKVKKQWVTISLALFMMISGGAVATHVSASADVNNQNQQQVQLNNKQGKKPSITNQAKSKHHALVNHAVQRNINRPQLHKSNNNTPLVNNHSAKKVNNVNQLKTNQSGNYQKYIYKRINVPFNTIRVTKSIRLHSSVNFDRSRIGVLPKGQIIKVNRAFKEFGFYNNYLRYEIRLADKRNAFITGNKNFVAYVIPNRNYKYYQNKINNLLKHANNKNATKLTKRFNKLNQQRKHSLNKYVGLYELAYNTQQNQKHPIIVNYHNKIAKINNDNGNVNHSKGMPKYTHLTEPSHNSLANLGSNASATTAPSHSASVAPSNEITPIYVAPASFNVPSSNSNSSVSSNAKSNVPSSSANTNSQSSSVNSKANRSVASSSSASIKASSAVSPSSNSKTNSSKASVKPSSKASNSSSASINPSSEASAKSSSVVQPSSNAKSASSKASIIPSSKSSTKPSSSSINPSSKASTNPSSSTKSASSKTNVAPSSSAESIKPSSANVVPSSKASTKSKSASSTASSSVSSSAVNPVSANINEIISTTFSDINNERKQKGVAPLSVNNQLQAVASMRANQLTKSFNHYNSKGQLYDTLDAEKVAPEFAGTIAENISQGDLTNNYMIYEEELGVSDKGQKDPIHYVNHNGKDIANMMNDAMMNWDANHSDGHRENILNGNNVTIGLGIAYNPENHRYYLAEDFSYYNGTNPTPINNF